MGMFRTRMLVASALAGSLLLGSNVAMAAEETAADAQGDIIVTAQRRNENLINVPMSISALSSEALKQAGVTNTADLGRVVPGVAMTFYGSFLQPSVRGITSAGANLGENSNVAMYIDGVYQPQQIATMIDLPDVQQIEVLKGPQGALYGQNATGGAILVSSMAPSFKLTGKFSASYGNHNDVQLRGYISGPLSDTVAVSLSGAVQDRDGLRTHVVTLQRDRGLNSKVVRGKVLFQPSDAVKITATGYYAKRVDSSMYAGFAINGNSVGYAADMTSLLGPAFGPFFPIPNSPKVTDPSQFSASPDVFTQIRSSGGSLRAEFDVGLGKITSNSGYFTNEINYRADVDGTAVQIGEALASPLTGKYFVHDTNFVSKDFGPISVLAGVFYLKGDETFVQNIFDLESPNLPPAARISLGGTNQYAKLEKEIIAGYGELTLKPVEKFTLTAGGRYTSEKQKAFSNLLNGVPQATVKAYPGNPASFSKFTPRVTLRYEVTPEINVFGSWAKGFKSGVVNITDYTIAPVLPENITSFEAGIKGKIGGVFHFNLAAFHYDYKDLQAVVFVPGKAYITQNAAAAKVDGADFDMSWNVTPEFTLSGGAAVLNARYTSFPGAQVLVPNGTGNNQVTLDISGRRLPRAPKFSGNIAANYLVETNYGKWGAYASLYHTSTFGMEPTNRLQQKGYTTVDGEISFSPSALDGLRLVVWGKNLGNKAYLASVLASTLGDVGSYATPRTFGFRAEFGF